MEYAEHGDMFEYAVRHKDHVDEAMAQHLLFQICHAIEVFIIPGIV